MPGFGGGGGAQEVTQNTSNLPEYAQPYFEDLMGRGGYEFSQPYTPYPGQRLADFSQPEQTAMDLMTYFGTQRGPEQIQSATDLANQAGQANPLQFHVGAGAATGHQALQGIGGQMGQLGFTPGGIHNTYQAQGVGGGSVIAPGVMDAYMSPYMQQVVDTQKEEAMRQSQIMGQEMALEAAGQGSLGGYREAIMQSERQRNLEDQLNDIQLIGTQAAFENAQQAFEADRQARLAAHDMTQGYGQEESRLGMTAGDLRNRYGLAAEQFGLDALTGQGNLVGLGQDILNSGYSTLNQGANTQLGAAGILGDLGAMDQGLTYDRIINMQAAGENQRGLEQAGYDIGYQDFLNQRDWGRNNLADYSAMLYGLPIAPTGSQSSIYQGGPSDWQQMLGSGIAGVGLYNAYGG